jgi:hypothetical protein
MRAGAGNTFGEMLGIVIAVTLAALVGALCGLLGMPPTVSLVAAVIVLIAGLPGVGYNAGRSGGDRS